MSPGRIFLLDEDSVLDYLGNIGKTTRGLLMEKVIRFCDVEKVKKSILGPLKSEKNRDIILTALLELSIKYIQEGKS
jgi:hypothetical protein